MAHNSLYPGFIKLFYTVSTLQHVATLPVLPFFSIVDEWWVEQKGGGGGTFWQDAVDDYVDVLRPLMNSTNAQINFAELWTYEDVDGDPIFRDTYEIDLAGSSGTAAVLMAQLVVTQRTINGGILRLYVMETIFPPNTVRIPPGFSNSALADWNAFINGNTSFLVGRDGSFPVAAIRMLTKTNDALRKKRQLFG